MVWTCLSFKTWSFSNVEPARQLKNKNEEQYFENWRFLSTKKSLIRSGNIKIIDRCDFHNRRFILWNHYHRIIKNCRSFIEEIIRLWLLNCRRFSTHLLNPPIFDTEVEWKHNFCSCCIHTTQNRSQNDLWLLPKEKKMKVNRRFFSSLFLFVSIKWRIDSIELH